MPSMSEGQLAAADLPDYIDQTIDPDNIRAAGQAVPNLRSLHRLLPHSGRALRPSSTSADNNANSDTRIIPMVQLGSAGIRQVISCRMPAAMHQDSQ